MLDAWASSPNIKNFHAYAASKIALSEFTTNSNNMLTNNIRVVGLELGATLYKPEQPATIFKSLQKELPTTIDDVLQLVDYIIETEELRGEIINIPKWKLTH